MQWGGLVAWVGGGEVGDVIGAIQQKDRKGGGATWAAPYLDSAEKDLPWRA